MAPDVTRGNATAVSIVDLLFRAYGLAMSKLQPRGSTVISSIERQYVTPPFSLGGFAAIRS